MSETILSSSSNSIEKVIDKYHDDTNYSGSSDGSHSSEGNSTDEGYTSGVLGFPVEVIQEQLRKVSGTERVVMLLLQWMRLLFKMQLLSRTLLRVLPKILLLSSCQHEYINNL